MKETTDSQLTPGQGLPAPDCSPREALYHSPPGSFYVQDGILSCAACDCEAESYQCDCENGFDGHDCGEDCCCCAYPEENVRCEACYGRGVQHYCENRDCAEHELWNRVELANLTEENT